jgi:hypothetical protein
VTESLVDRGRGRTDHYPGDNDSPDAEAARRELAAAVAAFLPPTPGQWLPKGYGTNAPAIRGPVGHEPRPGRARRSVDESSTAGMCPTCGRHQSEGNGHA